jgi:hypothetical protein
LEIGYVAGRMKGEDLTATIEHYLIAVQKPIHEQTALRRSVAIPNCMLPLTKLSVPKMEEANATPVIFGDFADALQFPNKGLRTFNHQ